MILPLQYDGRAVGELRLTEQNGDTVFDATFGRLPRGIYRIIACGERGELLLGVVEGEEKSLRRRFSAAIAGGVGKISAARAESCGESPQAWREVGEKDFPSLPRLPETALLRSIGRCRYLALPWRGEDPFPMPELFCFARIASVNGKNCAVFAFDEGGTPIFPQEN